MGKKIKLIPVGLTFSHSQRGAYALILKEEESPRRLPIIIGGFEAQSIAIELEKMKPPRPLTHDLFLRMAEAFGIQLLEVVIHELKEGIFYAKLVCRNSEKDLEIDSRTSDAIALALRFNCPIFTYDNILEEAGIVLENKENNPEPSEIITPEEPTEEIKPPTKEKVKDKPNTEFAKFSTKELNDMMEKAIEEEDYERASKIRDEIKKRQY